MKTQTVEDMNEDDLLSEIRSRELLHVVTPVAFPEEGARVRRLRKIVNDARRFTEDGKTPACG